MGYSTSTLKAKREALKVFIEGNPGLTGLEVKEQFPKISMKTILFEVEHRPKSVKAPRKIPRKLDFDDIGVS
jgi:hypothetical protein